MVVIQSHLPVINFFFGCYATLLWPMVSEIHGAFMLIMEVLHYYPEDRGKIYL
jgi:hypothetical protein